MMFSITIVFGPTGTNWRLIFKTKEETDAARRGLADWAAGKFGTLPFSIFDSFGQELAVRPETIHGWMVEDLDQTKLAAIEMSVHNGRAQADAEQAMRADPKIMSSVRNRSQGGPPILAPMGNGFTR